MKYIVLFLFLVGCGGYTHPFVPADSSIPENVDASVGQNLGVQETLPALDNTSTPNTTSAIRFHRKISFYDDRNPPIAP